MKHIILDNKPPSDHNRVYQHKRNLSHVYYMSSIDKTNTRVTIPDNLDPELYRKIGQFMGNTMLGIYKILKDKNLSFSLKTNDNVKVLMLVKFLNVCWYVMVTEKYDSQHGCNVKLHIIDEIAPLVPNESPRCIIHLLYNVGMHIINNVDIEGTSLDEQTGVALANQSAQIAYLYFKNRGIHRCTNAVTWNNMREQEYKPIWELKRVDNTAAVPSST